MLASLKAGPARSRWAGARSKLVAAVGALTCALVLSGCNDLIVGSWGSNFSGQLGDGTFVQADAPVAVDASGALGGIVNDQLGWRPAHHRQRLHLQDLRRSKGGHPSDLGRDDPTRA